MQIDREIHDVEKRLAQRRLKVELLARGASRRAISNVLSPAGLLGAAALGFVTVAGIMRRPRYVNRRSKGGGIVGSLAGLAATLGFQLLRAQLGSPAQMAQRAVGVLRHFFRRKSPGGDIRQAQHRAPFRG
jgi:hypothetical protein